MTQHNESYVSASITHPTKTPTIHRLFSTLLLVMLLAALDQTIAATARPTTVGELGGMVQETAYMLTSAIVGPLYGKFGDLFGRKIVLQIAIVIFLLARHLRISDGCWPTNWRLFSTTLLMALDILY